MNYDIFRCYTRLLTVLLHSIKKKRKSSKLSSPRSNKFFEQQFKVGREQLNNFEKRAEELVTFKDVFQRMSVLLQIKKCA